MIFLEVYFGLGVITSLLAILSDGLPTDLTDLLACVLAFIVLTVVWPWVWVSVCFNMFPSIEILKED